MSTIRERNPKQHQQDMSYLKTLSDTIDDGVLFVITKRQREVIMSLVNFYASWRTQYRDAKLDGEKYTTISDDDYYSILDTVARIPEEEEKMSSILDVLEGIKESIESLCQCIGGAIAQAIQDAGGVEEAGAAWNIIAPPGGQIPEPDPVDPPANDPDRCLWARAHVDWAINLCQAILGVFEDGLTPQALFWAVGGVFFAASGGVVGVGVAAGLIAAAAAWVASANSAQDVDNLRDLEDELVCAIYNAETIDNAESACFEIIEDATFTFIFRNFVYILFRNYMLTLTASGLIEIDETGLSDDCSSCNPPTYDFSFTASQDQGNEPWACGVYNHTTPPYSYTPSDEGCCGGESFQFDNTGFSAEWTLVVPAIGAASSVTVAIRSARDCDDPVAGWTLQNVAAGTYTTKVENITSNYNEGKVFIERGNFSASIYGLYLTVIND